MAEHALQTCRQLSRVLRTVIDAFDQGVFESYPSRGLLGIIPTGRKQSFHRVSLVDRHDFVTHLVADCVQRNGKIDLRKILREPRDHRHQPAGRNGDIAHAEVETVWIMDDV